MKAALIFLAIIVCILLWLSVDFKLGRKKHLSLAQPQETPILKGNLDIFPHGKELFKDYFRELENAKKHIHVLFYIVKDDSFSREFFSILKKKAKAGIEVRLLLDRLGSYKINRKMIQDLKIAGVEFSFCNTPCFPFLFYSSQVRNHRKITIIDCATGYLGGFNVAKEYIDEDPELSPWRDYHLKIKGESVSFIQQEFLTEWREYAKKDLLDHTDYFADIPEGEISHQLIPTEAHTLEGIYLQLIRSAKEAITIGTPYFIPSQKLFHELILAAQRGVSITIIVPFKTDHVLVQEASYRYLRKLLKAGALVYQYQKGFYHAKTVVIDEDICDIGSANFDKRSIFLNKEINCLIYDSIFIGRVKRVIQKDILDSKPLTLKELNQPNFFRSIKESLAGAISLFL